MSTPKWAEGAEAEQTREEVAHGAKGRPRKSKVSMCRKGKERLKEA